MKFFLYLVRVASLALMAIFLLPVVLGIPALAHEANREMGQGHRAEIFYNAACSGCTSYLQDDLESLLRQNGVEELTYKDFINQPKFRQELRQKTRRLGIPDAYLAHIMVFVDDRLVIAGHVPAAKLTPYLEDLPDQVTVLFQDEMTDIENQEVRIWKQGEISQSAKWLLPTVLVSGFLDGFNPCAFAVLLFFIAFLLTLQRTRANIWKMGLVYLAAIYLAYLLIGLGLMKAVIFSGRPHFMAKVGSWLMIGLGLVNIIEYFFPAFPIKMQIPKPAQKPIKQWLEKATIPAVFGGGFLVGLCTFPCSGSIYVGITTMLAATQTFFAGVGYLLLYNLAFIAPLVPVLAVAGNKRLLARIAYGHRKGNRILKLGIGIFSLALGIVILAFFVGH